jgi:predicted RNase H-like HicB family nuclease
MNKKYLVRIYWSDEDAAFLAEVPALPGCVTHGDTYAEAVANVEEAMEAWVESAERHGDPVPAPDDMLSEVRRLAPLLNMSELSRRTKINRNTLAAKIRRGTRFSDEESRSIASCVSEASVVRKAHKRPTRLVRA